MVFFLNVSFRRNLRFLISDSFIIEENRRKLKMKFLFKILNRRIKSKINKGVIILSNISDSLEVIKLDFFVILEGKIVVIAF